VHANLIGTDFQNRGILITMNMLFVIAVCVFFVKQYQTYQRKNELSLNQKKSHRLPVNSGYEEALTQVVDEHRVHRQDKVIEGSSGF